MALSLSGRLDNCVQHPILHLTRCPLLKIENSLINYWCLTISQISTNVSCSYMAISNLTYIPGFYYCFPFLSIFKDLDKSSYFNYLNQITPNLSGMVLVCSPLNIVSDILAIYSTWQPFLNRTIYLSFSALWSHILHAAKLQRVVENIIQVFLWFVFFSFSWFIPIIHIFRKQGSY